VAISSSRAPCCEQRALQCCSEICAVEKHQRQVPSGHQTYGPLRTLSNFKKNLPHFTDFARFLLHEPLDCSNLRIAEYPVLSCPDVRSTNRGFFIGGTDDW
jgi:hypothetical protein